MNAVITRYDPGQAPAQWIPGDVLLTFNTAKWWTRNGFCSSMIRFGQRLRFRGDRRQYARWNHVVCVSGTADAPHLVEALATGVVRSPTAKYNPAHIWYVHTDLTADERTDAVGYWEHMADTHAKYAFLNLAVLSVYLASGIRVGLSAPGKVICSGLAAAGLGSYDWRSNPSLVMPGNIAEYHGIGRDT